MCLPTKTGATTCRQPHTAPDGAALTLRTSPSPSARGRSRTECAGLAGIEGGGQRAQPGAGDLARRNGRSRSGQTADGEGPGRSGYRHEWPSREESRTRPCRRQRRPTTSRSSSSHGGQSRWRFVVHRPLGRPANRETRRASFGPHWLLPGIETALLAGLLAANPAHLVGRARWLRPLSITLIGLLVALAIATSGVLIVDLITGSEVTESATSLLASGAVIWLGNALVFGLLYWEFDGGGPLARYRRERPHPDFASRSY